MFLYVFVLQYIHTWYITNFFIFFLSFFSIIWKSLVTDDFGGDGAAHVEELRKDPLLKKIFRRMDRMVSRKYPRFHQHIMLTIPDEYRIFPEFCFTYLAKTGGTKRGFCHRHIDRNSIINGLCYLGVVTSGGETIFFDDMLEQIVGVKHLRGRFSLGPFCKVEHGAAWWEGQGRACIGGYVAWNCLSFFHKFILDPSTKNLSFAEHKWLERTEAQHTFKENEFNDVFQETYKQY